MRPLHRLPFVALACVLFGLLSPAPQAFADGLGYFEARRLLSDADAALAAGRHDQAAEVYAQVAEGTASGKSRHARALLGAAIAEVGRSDSDAEVARRYLVAYLADPAANEKVAARALTLLLDQVASLESAAETTPVAEPEPEPTPSAGRDAAKDQARIAGLQRQLAAAREEIAQKEKLIEELRKIVVEGGG